MSELCVSYGPTYFIGGEWYEPSWRVEIAGKKRCLVDGFAREKDAEIAKRFLDTKGLNWDVVFDESYGSEEGAEAYEKLLDEVMSNLQW